MLCFYMVLNYYNPSKNSILYVYLIMVRPIPFEVGISTTNYFGLAITIHSFKLALY
ncbi:Uncharacterised protein [Capnocytophaga canimorsus]|nr:hypothetical protein CLV61_0893 [Capnocytophaga canimorsus]STA72717.1 Uncharacterised protein [Capnocytophaga canimorsus]